MDRRKGFLLDMDGILVRGRQPIPGAQEFKARLISSATPFLVIANNTLYTSRNLSHRLTIGVIRQEDIDRFPFRPTRVLSSVADITVDGGPE